MSLKKKKFLIIGSSGGVGSAVKKIFLNNCEFETLDRDLWDMRFPENIDFYNFSKFDCIINCVGYNVGAHQGFLRNGILNQKNQVTVNFTSQLVVMKQYIKYRKDGHLIFFTSNNIDDPKAYNLFYTALRYSVNIMSKEFPNFYFSEICPGKIKSKMLSQNYQGNISNKTINEMYKNTQYITCKQVADVIKNVVHKKCRLVKWVNEEALYID